MPPCVRQDARWFSFCGHSGFFGREAHSALLLLHTARPKAYPQASVAESSVVLPPDRREPLMPTNTHLSDRPECPKCGLTMRLARIQPEAPREDRRTYECRVCNHAEDVIVKFE